MYSGGRVVDGYDYNAGSGTDSELARDLFLLKQHEWLLVDSTKPRPVVYPTLHSLLRAMFGTRLDSQMMKPVLITPLVLAPKTLDALTGHVECLGSILDVLPADWREPAYLGHEAKKDPPPSKLLDNGNGSVGGGNSDSDGSDGGGTEKAAI